MIGEDIFLRAARAGDADNPAELLDQVSERYWQKARYMRELRDVERWNLLKSWQTNLSLVVRTKALLTHTRC